MIMCRRAVRRAERPRCILKLFGVLLGLLLLAGPSLADETPTRPAPPPSGMPSVTDVPEAARTSPYFNAEAATEAYLARIPPAAKARSDAYFEGGYWLILWHYLYGAAVFLLLLRLGWSARMRDLAGKVTRFGPVHTFVYWAFFLVVVNVLASPMTFYEGFWREHHYGLANQSFGPWALDQLKGLLVGIVLGGILAVLVFGIVRRLRKSWWIWGAAATVLFLTFVAMIVPVFIDPIFNKVTRLDDARVTGPILRMARANGIPARDVYQIDASRQTNRISAEVSGIGSTLRITLNDNLLRRGSLEEIEAGTAHEMGHYVLNHTYKGIAFFAVLIVGAFAVLRWALARSIVRWGATWRVQDVGDTAVLPLVFLLASTIFLVLTPLTNTFVRTLEVEADLFGLNAAGQPDGFAQAAIHAGEYRKMSPGPIEEFIFYDHPSGRNRIFAAMRWKAEHLPMSSPPAPAR
jgi:STE24 endopeptidase